MPLPSSLSLYSSSLSLYSSSLSLYSSSLSLYSSFLSLYSLSHSSSSVLPLYDSHIVSSTLSLSLGSLPLFRFTSCRCLYQHSGLSDRRLTYPPPTDLARYRLSLLLTFYLLSTTSLLLLFDLAGLLLSTICPGVDYRLKDTYHQQDPPRSTLPRPTSDPPLAARRPTGTHAGPGAC